MDLGEMPAGGTPADLLVKLSEALIGRLQPPS
jgi:hypothetical protein